MAIKFLHDLDVLGNIDLNNNQSLNMVVQHLASDPTAVEGKIYYNTTNDVLKVCLGSTWTELSSATGDITSIVDGAGLTGSSLSSGAATLNVGSGTGITVNANDVAITAGGVGTTQLANDGVTADKLANSINSAIAANTAKTSNIVQTTITGNAGTATKIASITNSNIVQLATTQTLANKTLSTATLTGTPISTTPATSDNSTKIATTAYVRAYAAQSLQSGIGSGDLAIDDTDGLQDALNLKAPLASPTFTGTPVAPTASASTNSTKVATTAFVTTAISNLVGGAPGALNTLNELAAAIGDDASYASGITTALGLKAPIASPTFTGTVGGITKAMVGLGNVANIAVSGSNTGDESAAGTSTAGIVTRASDAEALAGTNTTKYITPKHLANRTYSATIGGATSIAVTHNLGTRNVAVTMYDSSSYETVYAEVVRTSTSVVTIGFSSAPASNDVTIVVNKI